jgi:hypothetical protein
MGLSATNPSAQTQAGIGKMPGEHIRRMAALPAPTPKQEPAKESRMRKLLIAVAASALALGACKTIDPFTGEEKYAALEAMTGEPNP